MDDITLRKLRTLLRAEVARLGGNGSNASHGQRWRTAVTALMVGLIGFVSGHFVWPREHSSLSNAENGIGIPAFVNQVRDELIASDIQREQNGQPALFTAKSVDLEVAFVVKRSYGVGSRASLQVVDVDTKREVSSEKTQKMILHLDVQPPVSLSIPPSQRTSP